jgi:hypothetical protein
MQLFETFGETAKRCIHLVRRRNSIILLLLHSILQHTPIQSSAVVLQVLVWDLALIFTLLQTEEDEGSMAFP